MKRLWLALVMIPLLTMTINAKNDNNDSLPHLRLVNVQNLLDIMQIFSNNAMLSPDGNLIVYESAISPHGLCIYDFLSTLTTCTAFPENNENGQPVNLGRPPEFRWSPNSQFVAFTENIFLYSEDSDIWLYDVRAGTFLDRTNDHYDGNVIFNENSRGIPIDVIPTWSRDGSLYFFRYIQQEDITSTQLFMVPSSGGNFAGAVRGGSGELSDQDPVLVADFTDNTSMPFTFYNSTDGFSLSGAAEVSSDGTQLALLMRPQRPDPYEIWVVNLLNGTITRRLPTSSISELGLADWVDPTGFVPQGITWAGNHELVVNFFNYDFTARLGWTAYHIDLETDVITPIFDFTTIPSQEEYYTGTQTESGIISYPAPRSATLTLDRDYLLYLTAPTLAEGATLEAIPILGGERTILHRFGEDFNRRLALFASIGTDGELVRALLYGYIFTFEITE